MKNIISLHCLVFLLLTTGTLQSQTMINKGRKLVIKPNTELVIKGDYINQADGDILNSGIISVTGDWTNNATSGSLLFGSLGSVKLNGSVTQNIGGLDQTHFYDLHILSETNINNLNSIQHELLLSNHKIRANNADLKMESGSTINGANSLAYVETSANGRLIMAVGNSDQTFPVGIATSYCPVVLNNHYPGGLDFMYVNVFPDVLDEGYSGSTINEIDDCVNLTWNIEEELPGSLDLSITAAWNLADEGSNFDRTRAGIGHYISGSEWIPQVENSALGADPYSLTRTGITDLSPFAVGDINSPMATPLHLNLDITVLLEGPYNGSDMNTGLNSDNHLPLSQPFNISPWNYNGIESVSSIPNGDVVDWLLVELRDASTAVLATPSTMIDRQVSFLLNDGSIVSMDGSSALHFSNVVSNNLFVVIWHRNHLGVMSAIPLIESGGAYSFDFTSNSAQAYNNGQKEINTTSNTYGLYGGNGDANNEVNINDKTNVWVLQAGQNGYKSGDFNLDGQVNNPDKNDVLIENIGASSEVPN